MLRLYRNAGEVGSAAAIYHARYAARMVVGPYGL